MEFVWQSRKEDGEEEQRQLALNYLTGAWIEAVSHGIDPAPIAQAAFMAAIKELVAIFGETYVGDMLKDLAPRVNAGEFSIHIARH